MAHLKKVFLIIVLGFIILSTIIVVETMEVLYGTWTGIQNCQNSDRGRNEYYITWYKVAKSNGTNQTIQAVNNTIIFTILTPLDDSIMDEMSVYQIKTKGTAERFMTKLKFYRVCSLFQFMKTKFNGEDFVEGGMGNCPLKKGDYILKSHLLHKPIALPAVVPTLFNHRGDFRVTITAKIARNQKYIKGCAELLFNLQSRNS